MRRRCGECGKFVAKDDECFEENGWCQFCEEEAFVESLEEEAELDPTGPASFILSHGQTDLRRGYS